jgi:hypothetical protein
MFILQLFLQVIDQSAGIDELNHKRRDGLCLYLGGVTLDETC